MYESDVSSKSRIILSAERMAILPTTCSLAAVGLVVPMPTLALGLKMRLPVVVEIVVAS